MPELEAGAQRGWVTQTHCLSGILPTPTTCQINNSQSLRDMHADYMPGQSLK